MAIDIASFTDLDAVAADAGGALDRGQQKLLFDRIGWFRLLTRHCDMPGTPLILRARDGEGAAWLFLARQSQRKATALANWYAFQAGSVIHGVPRPLLFEALGRQLKTLGLTAITLSPLAEQRLLLLAKPLRAAGWAVQTAQLTANWSIVPPSGGWDAYLATRPSRLRNIIKRKSSATGIEIRIINIFNEDDWRSYQDVYTSSWKPEEGSPAFLAALAKAEGDAGTLRLGLALHNQKTVAAQFWLVENGIATIHKLAHIETASAQSPGTLLTAAMFRHVIEEDQVEQIDFGTGDDAYKVDWMDDRRPLYHLSLFNPWTPTGLAGLARDRLSAVRAAIRRAG